MAVRVAFADSDCQCSMLLYHDLLTAVLQNKNQPLPDPLADTTEVRTALRDVLRSAQWLCKLTFRENDYQQVLELDCKHLEPFLEPQKPVEDLARFAQVLPQCALGKGCPVASLDVLNVDNELGILRAGQLDASAARVLIACNDIQLPDEEALQQDPQSASERSVDCLLAPQRQGEPVRAKLRAAGPASAVNWILRGRPGDVHQVVIMQTETIGEWSALWHAPIAIEAVASFVACWQFILDCQKGQNALLFQAEWTPGKRVRAVRDNMPSAAKKSSAWHSP